MVDKILKAGLKSPELISSLQLSTLNNSDIVLGFKVLALHKPEPPIFYHQFIYSFLCKTNQFNPYTLFFQDLEFSNLSAFMKSIIRNYYKRQIVELLPFQKFEIIELIKYVAELNSDIKYQDTSI